MIAGAFEASHLGVRLAYSRSKTFYRSNPARYEFPGFTYDIIRSTADRLMEQGILGGIIAPVGSHLKKNPEESVLWAPVHTLKALRGVKVRYTCPDSGLIVLRDSDKRPMDFTETTYTRTRRKQLQRLNRFAASFVKGVTFPDFLKIEIENGSYWIPGRNGEVAIPVDRDEWHYRLMHSRGDTPEGAQFAFNGRLHAPWQSVPKTIRREILINGDPTSEPDFRAFHPSMLYGLADARMVGDAYDVPDVERGHVKAALLKLINTQSEHEAVGSLRNSLREDLDPEDDTPNRELTRRAQHIIEQVKKRHAPIARYFCADMGIRLMKIEGEIGLRTLLDCELQAIPALGIHDSIRCRSADASKVAEIMQKAAGSVSSRFVDITIGYAKSDLPDAFLSSPPLPSPAVLASDWSVLFPGTPLPAAEPEPAQNAPYSPSLDSPVVSPILPPDAAVRPGQEVEERGGRWVPLAADDPRAKPHWETGRRFVAVWVGEPDVEPRHDDEYVQSVLDDLEADFRPVRASGLGELKRRTSRTKGRSGSVSPNLAPGSILPEADLQLALQARLAEMGIAHIEFLAAGPLDR